MRPFVDLTAVLTCPERPAYSATLGGPEQLHPERDAFLRWKQVKHSTGFQINEFEKTFKPLVLSSVLPLL